MKALLSIKPEFAEKIFSGKKCYEFRKTAFTHDVTNVIVYVTAPVGRIIGEFEVANVWQDTPITLWEKTKENAGITAEFFFKYFKGRSKAVAIEITNPRRYAKAINPYKKYTNFTPPQSFRYVKEARLSQISLR